MAGKKYVVEDDWATCTDGMIQQGVLVKSQSTVKACARSYNLLHPEEAEQDEKDRLVFLAKKAMAIEDEGKRKAFIDKKGLTGDVENDIKKFIEKQSTEKNLPDRPPTPMEIKIKELQSESKTSLEEGFKEKLLNLENEKELEKYLNENSLGKDFKPSDRSGEQVWKLVATEKDRFRDNFNCAKMTAVPALIGTIVGGVVGAAMGGAIGSTVGGFLFGGLGRGVGGIVGTVVGTVLGSSLGSAYATQKTLQAMNTFLPRFCYVLTYFSKWSSVHERVFLEKSYALMPDAKVSCFLRGIVSLSIPNMEMAINCAKASMYSYRDKKEDIHWEYNEKKGRYEASTDFGGDNYAGQTHAEFDKYNPKNAGWEQIDEDMGKRIAKNAGLEYQEYPLLDENGNPLRDENGGEIIERYFYDDETGTKTAIYETPSGEYVLVSRGTHNTERKSSVGPWVKDNGGQVGGVSPQYDQDARIGEAARDEIGDGAILITTGHSMAGGKGDLAGATGNSNESYTFNAAGVSPLTQLRYGVSDADMAYVYNFSSNYDPLTLVSDNVLIAPNLEGKRLVLDIESTSIGEEGIMGWFENGHDLPYLIAAMKKVPFIKVFALDD